MTDPLVSRRIADDLRRCFLLMLAAAVLVALACGAWAEPDSYDAARAKHEPVALSSLTQIAQQPSRFLKQAVEMRGRIMGALRGAMITTVMLKLDSGETVQLLARPEQPVVVAGGMARVVAQLAELPADCFTFNLLAMAAATATPPSQPPVSREQAYAELAQRQLAQADPSSVVPAQPRYVLPSRGGPAPSRDRILAAYADTIAYFNRRLDERERYTIAKYIIDFSERIGVDARLVMAVVACESNFKSTATSHAGAMGLGQLMPATAAGMGVRNPYDAKENLWAAIRIVRGHLENSEGDIARALACYNAGSGAVRRWGGIPPYRETQNYIRKVVDIYLRLAPEMAG